MLIMSRVCVEFHNRRGVKIFSVTPQTRMCMIEAPEAIQEDPIFQMLVDDGSLEASLTPARKKKLEQDPEDGTGPDGKRVVPNPEEELQEEKAEEKAAEEEPAKKQSRKSKSTGKAEAESSNQSNEEAVSAEFDNAVNEFEVRGTETE